MTISEDVGRKMFMAGLVLYVVSFFLIAMDKRSGQRQSPILAGTSHSLPS